jgi:hypothetical protein
MLVGTKHGDEWKDDEGKKEVEKAQTRNDGTTATDVVKVIKHRLDGSER